MPPGQFSTTRAAKSHLRAHIIPRLGSCCLPEISTKVLQGSSHTWLVVHSDARITLELYGHVVGDAQRNAVQNRSIKLVN
jgi:hypothetical protein